MVATKIVGFMLAALMMLAPTAEAADKKPVPAGPPAPSVIVPAVQTAWPGKIFVSHDEWVLSDIGLATAPDGGDLALNVATWFTGGRPGRFLFASTNMGLNEGGIAAVMTGAGHTWTSASVASLTLPLLRQYDALFIAGDAVDNMLLIDYVRGGGNVYLAGGTGWVSAEDEAARWSVFLNAFGLAFEPRYAFERASGPHPVASASPLFAGVTSLYEEWGSPITKLDPADPATQILVSQDGVGLYAAYGATVLPVAVEICPGRVELDSRSIVWVTVVGTPDLDVRKIDVSSLRLANVAARFSVIAHGAGASPGPRIGKGAVSACRWGNDRTADLLLWYDSRELLRAVALTLGEDLHDNDIVALTLTGRLKPQFGGTPIVGESLVKLEDRFKRRGWGWGWRRW